MYSCKGDHPNVEERSFLYAFNQKANGQLRLVFQVTMGKQSFYRMQADFQHLTIEKILDQKENLEKTVELQVVGASHKSGLTATLKRISIGDLQLSLKASPGAPALKVDLQQTISCEEYK